MKYRWPAYYRSFSCIGSACEDTCCAGWEISLDRKTVEKYRRAAGPFGCKLRKNINFTKGSFRMRGRRCPFLNKKNLCDIYSVLGEDMLSRTCKVYPRHMEIYGDLRELMLSLSCPEAARLILKDHDWSEGMEFTEREQEGVFLEDEIDGDLLRQLTVVRSAMFAILRDGRSPLDVRMGTVLALGHDVQRRLSQKTRCVDQEISILAENCGKRTAEEMGRLLEPYRGRNKERDSLMVSWVRMMSGLEPVAEEWGAAMKSVGCNFRQDDRSWRKPLKDSFRQTESIYENIMVYFLYTYLLGAVYDRDLYSKVKLAVVSCLMIREMDAVFYREKGSLSWDNQVWNAHLYSRQVENSDRNLETLERMVVSSPKFHFEEILICIMNG